MWHVKRPWSDKELQESETGTKYKQESESKKSEHYLVCHSDGEWQESESEKIKCEKLEELGGTVVGHNDREWEESESEKGKTGRIWRNSGLPEWWKVTRNWKWKMKG